MNDCDVLVVGGGPAGSTCAWKLRQAGLEVVVMDAATFPRDKVCAGWITPAVLTELDFDSESYRSERTFQPISGFCVGLIGGEAPRETAYSRPVSFGIRRCEFDHYLLQRSGARLRLGSPLTSIRRSGPSWVVNESLRTPMLVGAGGQFCPVARWMNGPTNVGALVVAQETEFAIESADAASFRIEPAVPELYFCNDLKGYGWCFRKGHYLNIGLGRMDRQSLPAATARFVEFLHAMGKIPSRSAWRWRGHAYGLFGVSQRSVVDDGVMLVGDAAGLAYPQSGEGIRPAVESGLLAAATILAADGSYTRNRLNRYQERLEVRFGSGALSRALSRMLPDGVVSAMAARLLDVPAFVRHVVLDRWFLHAHEPALTLH